jgi:hypothetical protein
VISTQQWTSVVNKLSALVPTSEGTEIAVLYLEEDVSSNPAFQACVQRLLGHYVHDEGRRGIGFILNALKYGMFSVCFICCRHSTLTTKFSTQAGSLFLTGSTKLFHQQPIAFREKVFQGWASSRLPSLRKAYRGLSAIMKKSWVLSSGTLNHVLGFPPIPIPLKPTNGFPYTFLQFPAGDEPEVVETDVVIIGSGCGGAVAAKNLGEAGLRVIVVEKSYCYSSKSFPMAQNEAYINMFENAGAIMSEDGTVAIMAGSTWGGGGTVNWSACLQTQAHVRKEWANTGLSLFTSLEFQRSLDRVCDRMGVNTDHVKHNCQNDIILEGAHKLGYAAKSVPQNTGNSEHYCGHCTLGCQSAGKKGPTETFLADAAKAEAVFIEGFTANKVLFKMDTKNGKRVPVGVEGIWTSRDAYHGVVGDGAVKRRLIIHAKKVVLSSGTLQSPLLLLRSGIKNPEIGKNLYLHPGKISVILIFAFDCHCENFADRSKKS